MRKVLLALLALALLAYAPAMAQGHALALGVQGKTTAVFLDGKLLSDEALAEYQGAFWPHVVYLAANTAIGAVTGAVAGYVATGQVTCEHVGGGAAIGFLNAVRGYLKPPGR